MAREAVRLAPASASARYLEARILLQLKRDGEAQNELAVMRKLQKAASDRLEREMAGSAYRDPQLAGEGK
ncbi:MAG TPA: hypothetical protein VLT57_09810, partial [Bryobacteraceae bacterium]|nr:hypothetical protein [Bryobacteraceae bacterium]